MILRRPNDTEYNPRFSHYIDLVPESDLAAAMSKQLTDTQTMISAISTSKSDFRYAPEKWSVKEVIGHILDTERIMGYRLLCFARGEAINLQRADENLYVKNADFARFTIQELFDEFALVRKSHIVLLDHLPEEAWDREGSMAGNPISVRAVAYIMLGHERHHLGVIQDKYLQNN